MSVGRAQTAQPPVMGYTVDRAAGTLRAVLGVPGAAVLGPVQEISGTPWEASPSGTYAVLLRGEGRRPVLWQPSGEIVPLPGLPGAPAQVVLSPRGGSAAFYYASTRTALLISGLPDSPSAPRSISMSSAPAGMAVSEDGTLLVNLEGSDAVVRSEAGVVSRLSMPDPVDTAAFSESGHDLLLAAGSRVDWVRDADIPGLRTSVAHDLSSVSGASLSTAAIILAGGTGAVEVISLLPGDPALQLDCQCAATGVTRMYDGSSYRLTSGQGGQFVMLERPLSGSPRLLVVPPVEPVASATAAVRNSAIN